MSSKHATAFKGEKQRLWGPTSDSGLCEADPLMSQVTFHGWTEPALCTITGCWIISKAEWKAGSEQYAVLHSGSKTHLKSGSRQVPLSFIGLIGTTWYYFWLNVQDMTCLPRDKTDPNGWGPPVTGDLYWGKDRTGKGAIFEYNHEGAGSRPASSWNSKIILEFQSHIKGNFTVPPLQFATLHSSQMAIKKSTWCVSIKL